MTDDNQPKLDDPQMMQAANKFALLLVQNKDLLMAWFDMLAKALKNKQYEVQIMDNFIAEKSLNKVDDFDTTYGYVIQAQQKLAAYQIYYWSGLYKTTKKPKDGSTDFTEGDPVSVVGSGSNSTAPFVSLAQAELIGYTFDNLVLSWDGADGLNSTTGNLIFGVRNISGVATKTFAGTITEDNVEYVYAGVLVDPKSSEGQKQTARSAPQTHSSLQKLEYANQIINMVSQALFMAVNIGMLYKAGKEIQELRARIGKGEGGADAQKQMADKEAAQATSEKAADQAAEKADAVKEPVEAMDEDAFQTGAADASPATESSELPDIDPPAYTDVVKLSEEEASVAQEAIENEVESRGEEPNTSEDGEGSEGGEEGEGGEEVAAMEDGEDVLTTSLGDFAIL